MAEAAVEGAPPVKEAIYTRPYILLWLSELSIFASFYVLLPVIPLYIVEMGGNTAQVGILLAVAGIAQLITAPLFGRAVDVIGRKPVLLVGIVATGFVAASFTAMRAVWMFSLPLMGRSLSTGATQAASRTLVFDLAPLARRGEAVSSFMLSHNVAIAFGPPLGLAVLGWWGFNAPFLLGVGMCVVSFLLILPIKAPAPTFTASAKGWRDWLVPEVAMPAIVQLLLAISYISTIQFLSLMGEERGIDSYQAFFTVYAVSVITVRVLTGRVSDRYGRAAVLLPALVMQAVALFILAGASNLALLALAAVGFGMGWGAAYPMLTTIAGDRVGPQRRGTALGVMAASMAMGSSLGTVSVGFIADAVGFAGAYLFTGGIVLFALLIAVVALRRSGELRLAPASMQA